MLSANETDEANRVTLAAMNRSEICDRFLDALEFELYPFQEEALLAWFEEDEGVLISAPTGMGKTLIAEAAIFEALHSRRRLFYTTPLIALTDQKFREFQDKALAWGFAREDIGLITGNRRINPNACVRVVVAEILLNHLLSEEEKIDDVGGVVMDEFHYFNDYERGVVWELSLVFLPKQARLMLLSATVGNAGEFMQWLSKEHGRQLTLVQSDQRRVPLEYVWVADKLLTDQLVTMVSENDEDNRCPALVFCFNRDECWEVAERLKGLKLIGPADRAQIDERLNPNDFLDGIGPKLRQMLIRGVGVHHAGVLPKYKECVESLFLAKLVPFVVCTETLAAGVNLPARSVVLSALIKGKPREKKLIPPSAAHQMFGRAGRPQFDKNGYVYAMTHEDDAKIAKWKKKYDAIDPKSKDPGIMRVRKQLERKKPSRRKTEQYWMEGQFRSLIAAKPANLASRSMIPYQVLIYLLRKTRRITEVRKFLSKRFNTPDRIESFQRQLDHMLGNLASLGYISYDEDANELTLNESLETLHGYRSIDPLFAAFLQSQLVRANFQEKLETLESVLQLPPAIAKRLALPDLREPGPLETGVLESELLQRGLATAHPSGGLAKVVEDVGADYFAEDEEPPRMVVTEMLKVLFEAKIETPELVFIQPKWVAGGIGDAGGDFFKFAKSKNLEKNEGLILRHLLRLAILSGEFSDHSDGDPAYQEIGELVTAACMSVDPRYTDRFLEADAKAKQIVPE